MLNFSNNKTSEVEKSFAFINRKQQLKIFQNYPSRHRDLVKYLNEQQTLSFEEAIHQQMQAVVQKRQTIISTLYAIEEYLACLREKTVALYCAVHQVELLHSNFKKDHVIHQWRYSIPEPTNYCEYQVVYHLFHEVRAQCLAYRAELLEIDNALMKNGVILTKCLQLGPHYFRMTSSVLFNFKAFSGPLFNCSEDYDFYEAMNQSQSSDPTATLAKCVDEDSMEQCVLRFLDNLIALARPSKEKFTFSGPISKIDWEAQQHIEQFAQEFWQERRAMHLRLAQEVVQYESRMQQKISLLQLFQAALKSAYNPCLDSQRELLNQTLFNWQIEQQQEKKATPLATPLYDYVDHLYAAVSYCVDHFNPKEKTGRYVKIKPLEF